MCGIAGILSGRPRADGARLAETVGRMADTLAHRGPDDAGTWVAAEEGVALGHRRLSIIDLSPAGRQPMVSASGRYVMDYNGEIYNFPELRRELEAAGARFRGRCDTEVMLAAIERWGLEPALERFIGMFAFALWDRDARHLFLVRDRLGIKPLYYGRAGGDFVFASELKAMRRHPDFAPEIDRNALALMLRYGYVPAPHTIFRTAHKLPPGHILRVSAETAHAPVLRAYWSARTVYERALNDRFAGDEAQAAAALDGVLRDAVGRRMIADVPLGALLSGGLDSSTVTAVMQSLSARPVRTFTVGFHERAFDEAGMAREVARRLGTDHTELYLAPREALDAIPSLAGIYDEPFGDSSQIPTLLISRIARRQVTVALSGDGGDELFAGYRRYDFAATYWESARRLPRWARRACAAALTAPPERFWNRAFAAAGRLVPAPLRKPEPGSRVHALAAALGAADTHEFYDRVMSQWPEAAQAVPGALPPPTPLSDPDGAPVSGDTVERLMYVDLLTYLPDDILTKVDRASMAAGLELRVPLLDHRIVEFAARLPLAFKRRPGRSKWILRKVCGRYLPAELFDRPKTGFSVPLAAWLRGPLRPWAEDLLDPSHLGRDGYLDAAAVRRRWDEHVSGKGDRSQALWNVLMFQQWLAALKSPAAP